VFLPQSERPSFAPMSPVTKARPQVADEGEYVE
jgi:hypothetical protein